MTKQLENLIQEMHKKLETLVVKVSVLEARIGEQNTIILDQSQLIRLNDVTSETPPAIATRKQTPIVAAPAPAALQRPIRQARLNAGLSLSAKAAAKKTVAVSKPRVSTTNAPMTPETGRSVIDNCHTPEDGAMKVAKSATVINVPVPLVVKDQDRDSKEPNQDESNWQTVTHRRARNQTKRRTINIGTGKEDNELQTVEQLKYIQAWSFKPNTTEENILNFLNKIVRSDEYFVEKRKILSIKHASFIIGIPESLYPRINTPAAWPPRVRYSDWFLARPRAERGSCATTSPTTSRSTDQH